MKSASRCGRTLASMRASSSSGAPETIRCCGFGIYSPNASEVKLIVLQTPTRARSTRPGRRTGRGAQALQSGAQQRFKILGMPGGGGVAAMFVEGALGVAALVAEIEESGEEIRCEVARRAAAPGRGRLRRSELVAQLHDDALRRLAAHAGNARELYQVALANGGGDVFGAHAGQGLVGEG